LNNSVWAEHLSHWCAFLTERLSSIDGSDKDENEKGGERVKAERQLVAIERVRCAAVGNPRLLVEFINPSDRLAEAAECRDFFRELNRSQQEAVNTALGGGVLSLIQGPPGTGKTTVIAEICLQLCRRNPDVRILVCSETHVAVNHLIACISEYRDEIRIVRIQDKEPNSLADEFSPDVIINKYSEWLRESCNDDDIIDIVTQSLSNGSSLEKALALSANVVGMTCNRVGAYEFSATSELFDVAIIDEVCKATLPEILMPLMIAQKAVLVGDPRQLPPVFCSEEIDIIRSIDICNLRQYMYIDELFLRSEHVTLLDTQYRMTKQIGSLIGTL